MLRTEIQAAVMSLTGITWDEYTEQQEQLGIAYLFTYTGGDTLGVNLTCRTQAYWLWYNNQWDIIDLKFLNSYRYTGEGHPDKATRRWLKNEWITAHQPEQMNSYPGKYVIDAAWAAMMGEAIDEIHREEIYA